MSNRKPEYPILDVIVNRWSGKSMSGESISNNELMTLFEAARWAPSAFNGQPWRFIYTTRDKESWNKYLDLLVNANKVWAKDGAVLILIVSRKYFEYNNKYSRTHSFDTGAAWENLAIQGCSMGLIVHALEGFDYMKAREEFKVPNEYDLECMVVVGKPAKAEILVKELEKREKLDHRKPLKEIVFKDIFGNK